MRHAAVPRTRPGRHRTGHTVHWWHRATAAVPAVHILGRCRPVRRDLVHGGPDHPRPTAHPGATTARATQAPAPVRPLLLGAAAHGAVAALRGGDRRSAGR